MMQRISPAVPIGDSMGIWAALTRVTAVEESLFDTGSGVVALTVAVLLNDVPGVAGPEMATTIWKVADTPEPSVAIVSVIELGVPPSVKDGPESWVWET